MSCVWSTRHAKTSVCSKVYCDVALAASFRKPKKWERKSRGNVFLYVLHCQLRDTLFYTSMMPGTTKLAFNLHSTFNLPHFHLLYVMCDVNVSEVKMTCLIMQCVVVVVKCQFGDAHHL